MVEFDSPSSARDYLAEKYPSDAKIVFRGEPAKFPGSQPTCWRLPQSEQGSAFALCQRTARHIFDSYLAQHLRCQDDAPYFGERFFGESAQDLNGVWTVADWSYAESQRGIEGMLQHYGLESSWLDLTSVPFD